MQIMWMPHSALGHNVSLNMHVESTKHIKARMLINNKQIKQAKTSIKCYRIMKKKINRVLNQPIHLWWHIWTLPNQATDQSIWNYRGEWVHSWTTILVNSLSIMHFVRLADLCLTCSNLATTTLGNGQILTERFFSMYPYILLLKPSICHYLVNDH